jgi:DNA-binding GntR family transcriptional regulator
VDGINHSGPDFPYLQLAAELRSLVAGLQPNDPLPSIARLCEESGLSYKTVRKALAELERDGLIYVRASRGAFKSPQ